MDNRSEKEILDLVERARTKSEAFIVVGILPGDRIFYSADPRIGIADPHGALQRNVDWICESVANTRRRAQEQR